MKKKAWLAVLAVLILGAAACAGIILYRNHQTEASYQKAMAKAAEGDTGEAWRMLKGLGGYKDAKEKLTELAAADGTLPFRMAEKGETVSFGRWEQDGNADNGPEPIEWIVMDKVDGQVLLLSSLCLTGRAYHTAAFEPVTWETCSLREWLNGEFLSEAFTEEERELIPAVVHENPNHSIVETPGGRDTEDRVFLLSERETVIYFRDEADRQSIGRAPASEAAAQGGLQVNGDGIASWWLRSPGMYEYIAQFVDQEGNTYQNGGSTDIDYLCGVRPAIWIGAK